MESKISAGCLSKEPNFEYVEKLKLEKTPAFGLPVTTKPNKQ